MRPPLLLAAISALALCSCFSPGDGQAPPLERFYFPTGVVLDSVTLTEPTDLSTQARAGQAAPKFLYVASSDFDLQYRSSSLASFDLEAISRVVPRSCTDDDDPNCDMGEVCDNWDNVAAKAKADAMPKLRVPSFFCLSADNNANDKPCGMFGEHTDADKLIYPGRCNFID